MSTMPAAVLDEVLKRLKQGPQMEDAEFNCPQTGIALPRRPLRATIVVPDEWDAVAALLDGTLNSVDCHCGSRHTLQVCVIAVDRDTASAVCVTAGAPPAEMGDALKALGSPFDEAVLVDDYDALLRRVLGWLDGLLGAYARSVLDGTFANLARKTRIERRLPALLIFLRDLGEGRLPSSVRLADGRAASPEVAREFHARLHSNAVVAQLEDILAERGFTGMLAEAEARLPARALGEGVLSRLATAAAEGLKPVWVPDGPVVASKRAFDLDLFMKAWRPGLACAVAHVLAGLENPQAAGFAALLRLAWQGVGDEADAWLPPAEQVGRLAGFEPLWDSCRVEMDRALGSGKTAGMDVFDDLERMFGRLGHGERFAKMIAAQPIRFAAEKDQSDDLAAARDEVVEAFLAQVLGNFPLGRGFAASRASGGAAAAAVRVMLGNDRIDEGTALAERYLATAMGKSDAVAACAFAAAAIPAFCPAVDLEFATRIVDRLTPLFEPPPVSRRLQRDGRLVVRFWNEVGNVRRYTGRFHEALRCYGTSRSFLPLVADAKGRAADASVLALNEGIVFRDLGRFSEALPKLVAAVEAAPRDAGRHINLAVLYLRTGRYQQAAAAADSALALADATTGPSDRIVALQVRAQASMLQGADEAASADLAQAMQATPAARTALRQQIAAAAAQVKGARRHQPGLLALSEQVLREGLVSETANRHRVLRVLPTVLAGLGMLLLNEERDSDLAAFDRDHLQPFLARVARDAMVDWRLLRLKGLLELRRAGVWTAGVWEWFDQAAANIASEMPEGRESAFARGWFAEKDAFQLELAEGTVAMVEQGAMPAAMLLHAFEFGNGRDLAAALHAVDRKSVAHEDPCRALRDLADRLGREIVLVELLDSPSTTHLVTLGARDGACAVRASWPAQRVLAANRSFLRMIDMTNPAAPPESALGAATAELLAELGGAIAPHLPADALLVFLPGRRMTNLPLHLAPLPQDRGPLLLEHPVVFAPNLTLLLDEPPAVERQDRSIVVAVAKDRDSRVFRKRLALATRRITGAPAGRRQASRHLSGRRATPARVLEELARADDLFLLCHGARIGRRRGYGIYLSDGRDLPPAMAVDVEVRPEIGRFALSWEDFSAAPSTPRLVVSLACSSARTIVEVGGVRVGPEAAAFAKGTRSVVAPLWNVDQETALAWVQHFEAARRQAGLRIWDAHREASLAVRRDHPHAFFWGPFILTARLNGEIENV